MVEAIAVHGAAYVVACTKVLALRAAYDKYGETQCTTSSCLTLYIDGFTYSFATVCSI